MISPTITHDRGPVTLLAEICESVTPNFAALLVVAAVAFIWVELSPLWLPSALWLISFLEPVFCFLFEICAALAGVFLLGFTLAILGLLLGGTIPSSR